MAMDHKLATGKKANIANAIKNQTLKPGTMVVTSDTDEIAFINANSEAKFLKDRIGEDIVVNGVNIGNLTDGKTISKDLTLADFIKAMVQKPIPATYTQPSVALANNAGTAAGTFEAGTSVTPKLRATFNKNDAGDLSKIVIKKGTEEVQTGTESPLEYTGTAIVVGDETVSFTATATYAEGAIKNNNLGESSPNGHITAGSKTSAAFNYVGKRNLFYGTGTGSTPALTSDVVRALSNKRLGAGQGTQFTINIAVGQQYVLIAYPATIRDISTVKYEETNDATVAQNFAKSTVKVADARGGANGLMDYKVFKFEMAAPAAAAMTFTVTV